MFDCELSRPVRDEIVYRTTYSTHILCLRHIDFAMFNNFLIIRMSRKVRKEKNSPLPS